MRFFLYAPIMVYLLVSLAACHRKHTDEYQSIVKLTGEHALCTGFEVEAPSGHHYILTASHCALIEDDRHTMKVTTEDGEEFQSRVIAVDSSSDLLLLEGSPTLPALKVAEDDERGERIRIIGHGLGLDTWEVPGYIIQLDEQMLDWQESVCSAGIQPGHSGSPVLDPNGQVVGVASTSNYFISGFVKLTDIQRFLSAY